MLGEAEVAVLMTSGSLTSQLDSWRQSITVQKPDLLMVLRLRATEHSTERHLQDFC